MLATVADRRGKPWSEVLQAALTSYEPVGVEGEIDLRAEYRELFPDCDPGQKPVSLERMHQILSKVTGSLASDIIADREDRR